MKQIASGTLAAAAVTVAVFWNGGFDPTPQWLFAALAVAAFVLSPARPSLPATLLAALAGLGALSAAWTIGPPEGALRWGAVALGYAALAASVRRFAVEAIVAVAAITGLAGLVSAATFSTAFAERLAGGWRPEGPFGYPPALALVQVFALPALLSSAARGRMLAAPGLAVAAGVIALDGSRVAVALGVLVAIAGIVAPVAPRGRLAGAIGLATVCGLVVHAAIGGWHARRAHASSWDLAIVLATVVAAGPIWMLVRGRLSERPSARVRLPRAVVAGLAVAAAAGVAIGTAGPLGASRFPADNGFTHGRTWMWHVAVDAARARPLAGSGAGTFLRATILDQPGRGRQTRFAHDLPLELAAELGVLGFVLALGLYGATVRALWRARGSEAVWLAGPAAAAFLISNTVDWTWHLAGVGVLFALSLAALSPPGRQVLPARPPAQHPSSSGRFRFPPAPRRQARRR